MELFSSVNHKKTDKFNLISVCSLKNFKISCDYIQYFFIMDNDYVVQTEYGKVRGYLQTSLVDIPYIRFLGIPYATPPVGNLRFKVRFIILRRIL